MTLQFHIFYQNDMQIPCVAFMDPIMDGNGANGWGFMFAPFVPI